MPLGVSLDLRDPAHERNHMNGNFEVSVHGEATSLIDHEQNGDIGQVPSPASGGSKPAISRSISGTKSFCNGVMDLEDGKVEDRDRILYSHILGKVHDHALFSGVAYCISSCSMILVNKVVLSGYDFNGGIFLMLYQNLVCVIIVSLLSFFGIISTEPLAWKLVRVWLPVNVMFVGMLITSNLSLRYINVAMVIILKNVTNVITAVGELYLFNKHHDAQVWMALCFMIISAISGGFTDLTFHAVGYSWQILNCFLTASYSLTLRRVMDTAKQVTKSGNLNEFSMVLLNNSLSLPLGLLLIVAFSEIDYISTTPLLRMPVFWMVITASGVIGFAISFTSMWFLHQTGATTYSLVGSLNKIPLSIAGILLFDVPTTIENLSSICFGLLAGLFFTRAKFMTKARPGHLTCARPSFWMLFKSNVHLDSLPLQFRTSMNSEAQICNDKFSEERSEATVLSI